MATSLLLRENQRRDEERSQHGQVPAHVFFWDEAATPHSSPKQAWDGSPPPEGLEVTVASAAGDGASLHEFPLRPLLSKRGSSTPSKGA